MRSPLSFAGSILLISCVGSTVQDQTTGSEATAEETRTLSEISKNEYESADTWGQIIETPPETFFAADLSDDVRDGLTDALLVATSEWGNFGPLEYWVPIWTLPRTLLNDSVNVARSVGILKNLNA